eukprot:GEMP01022589.1.p1 GENE.GEMP01022589.1~~GEMP01022589.1.p1  ORF type:complete len:481 (+),score=93.60 GEMP01022589.1:245-1687(+)
MSRQVYAREPSSDSARTMQRRSSAGSSRDGKVFEIRRRVRINSLHVEDLETYQRWALGCEAIGDIVAFVNSESGSGVGEAIVHELVKLQCEVCDLADPLQPKQLLTRLKVAQRKRYIVCGGDGTVTWILRELENAGVEGPVAIVPLGTGNDLSRSLGWGPHLENISDLSQYLRWVAEAQEVPLDMWRITVVTDEPLPQNHKFYSLGSHPRPTDDTNTFVGYFQNYFSIGLDAKVTYLVEESRKQTRCGRLMFRRGLGKCVYAWNGAKQACLKGCCQRLLTPYIRLDSPVSLAERKIQSCLVRGRCRQISVININSYAGGQKAYHGSQHPADGLLEVLAMRNFCCALGLFGGCSSMHYVDTLPDVEFKLSEPTYMQIDGESWHLPSTCTVSIVRHQTVSMLRAPENGRFWTKAHPAEFWTTDASQNAPMSASSGGCGVELRATASRRPTSVDEVARRAAESVEQACVNESETSQVDAKNVM